MTCQTYLGGSVRWFDYCEADYMSILELRGMAKMVGYDSGVSFYGDELVSRELMEISSDEKLLCCMISVHKTNTIVVVINSNMRVPKRKRQSWKNTYMSKLMMKVLRLMMVKVLMKRMISRILILLISIMNK